MVISEDRTGVSTSLKDFANTIVTNMAKKGADGTHTDWESVKVNGNDALRCDLHVTVGQLKVAYVVTVIQTKENFHQVLAWSTEASFEKMKPDLVKLADGLKEKAAN